MASTPTCGPWNESKAAIFRARGRLAYHVIGGAVAPMYFTTAGGVSLAFGDSIQRGVDTWAWEWGNRMKGEIDGKVNPRSRTSTLRSTINCRS
ncbi:hypothetical protein [Streptomyces sp. NBC_00211]|uniref:hypothetical protein n=1 Tax=Streptomyces sp. NBC_00211 TaxID=2975683 RepID=UPI002F90F4C4